MWWLHETLCGYSSRFLLLALPTMFSWGFPFVCVHVCVHTHECVLYAVLTFFKQSNTGDFGVCLYLWLRLLPTAAPMRISAHLVREAWRWGVPLMPSLLLWTRLTLRGFPFWRAHPLWLWANAGVSSYISFSLLSPYFSQVDIRETQSPAAWFSSPPFSRVFNFQASLWEKMLLLPDTQHRNGSRASSAAMSDKRWNQPLPWQSSHKTPLPLNLPLERILPIKQVASILSILIFSLYSFPSTVFLKSFRVSRLLMTPIKQHSNGIIFKHISSIHEVLLWKRNLI